MYGHTREWCGKGVHNAGTEVNNEKVIDSSKDSVPFDPWMVASHKNRHPRKEIGKQRDDGDEHGPSKSSTFHVLQDLDEEIDLEHRVEVLDSARLEGKRPTSHVKDKQPIHALSEPRHSSAPFHVVVQPGSASSTVAGSSNERRASLEHNQVDPLVVGKSVQDVAVRNITQGGNHKATLIVEEGQDLRMHAGGDIVNVSGGKSKRKMDVSSKGLRIQKRSEFKIPTKPTLAEWMSLVPEKPVRSSVRDVPTTKLDPGLEPPIVKQSVAGSSLSLVSDPVIDISLATDCDMQDLWVGLMGPLLEFIENPSLIPDVHCSVAAMVNENGDRDWAQFSSILPPSLVLRIAAIKPPFESDLEGVPGWRWDPLHSFSVRSAYSSLTGAAHVVDSEDKGWSLIGKFKGSPLVRSFLWLVYWDSILTNHERVQRFLTSDASFSYCGTVVEDTLHVFRDCPATTTIWSTVIKPELMGEFCSLDTRKWLHMNLDGGCRFPRNPLHWDIMFGYILWNLWCQRNTRIFDADLVHHESILVRCSRMVSEVIASNTQQFAGLVATSPGQGPHRLRRWVLPPEGWVTCNADGQWEVRLLVINRESNKVADALANLAWSLSFGFHDFVDPSSIVSGLVMADLPG
ncbi:hypothetical protein V6N13_027748 [Hibiscus sabdariffa]